MKSELQRLQFEQKTTNEKIKENAEKLKMNKQLPYLVANCVEVNPLLIYLDVFLNWSLLVQLGNLAFDIILVQILDINPDEEEDEEGDAVELSAQKKGKCVVVKTSTRQVWYSVIVSSSFFFRSLFLLSIASSSLS